MAREALRAYCRETDITELLEWCVDEGSGNEGELQLLGLTVAVRAGLMKEFIEEYKIENKLTFTDKIDKMSLLLQMVEMMM